MIIINKDLTKAQHPTNDEVYRLLTTVIYESWGPMAIGQPSRSDESLCQIADAINGSNGSCDGCPVFELNARFAGCEFTPYQSWLKAKRSGDKMWMMVAAIHQESFLISVREFYFGANAENNVNYLLETKSES